MTLAISASHEFIEWGVALVVGMDTDAFLATQGDVWDTQWETCSWRCWAHILPSRLHDRQLARLPS